MKIKLQATGYAPLEFEAIRVIGSEQTLEGSKRGVEMTFYEMSGGWVASILYKTSWGIERPFMRLTGLPLSVPPLIVGGPPTCKPLSHLECAEWARKMAEDVLPPGAGFPATPQFETRQAKLKGMMQTLTLVALSEVLAQV